MPKSIGTGRGYFGVYDGGRVSRHGLHGFKGIQEMGVICGGGLLVSGAMMALLPCCCADAKVLDHELAGKVDHRARSKTPLAAVGAGDHCDDGIVFRIRVADGKSVFRLQPAEHANHKGCPPLILRPSSSRRRPTPQATVTPTPWPIGFVCRGRHRFPDAGGGGKADQTTTHRYGRGFHCQVSHGESGRKLR